MYCDLRKLEDSNTCERWLTTVDDDEKWTEYAKQNGFTDKPSTGKYEEIIFEDVRIALVESSLTLTLPTKNFLTVHSASKRP